VCTEGSLGLTKKKSVGKNLINFLTFVKLSIKGIKKGGVKETNFKKGIAVLNPYLQSLRLYAGITL
jgi:hypothetical protein